MASPQLVPVDIDPFAAAAAAAGTGAAPPPVAPEPDYAAMPPGQLHSMLNPGYTPEEIAASKPQLVPVEHDPFAGMTHPVEGPSGNILTDTARRIGSAVVNAGVGLVSPLLDRPNAVGVGASGITSGPTPSPQQAQSNAFNTAGFSEYAPETWAGRRVQDALTGGAGALMTGNPAAAIPTAAGSATSGEAREDFPNHPLLASMLGFIPGAWMGNQAATLPQRAMAPLIGTAQNPTYAAFQRQGLPTSLAGTSTGEPMPTYAEKLAARMPGSEGVVSDARNNLMSAWQNRLDQVTGSLGTAASATEAGRSLQSAAQGWLQNFKNTTGQLWQDFYSKVPQNTPVPVSGYQSALTNLMGNFPGASATGAVLRPGTVQSLSDALGVDLKQGNTLPWEAVKNIRTAIGEKLANPQTVADTSQAALKQLYAGLSSDMEAGAGGVSQDALSSFHRANAATAAGHDLLENQLDPILKATNPEDATSYALAKARSGGSRLGAITFNLPGAAGDLAAYTLRNVAGSPEGPLTQGNASPTSLARSLVGPRPVLSPEAQQVLFPQASTQGDIADLATVGKAMQPLEKDLANSPTATHTARGLGRVMMGAELARQGHELAGIPGAVAGGLLGVGAPDILGRVAQVGAVNPYLAALYARSIPYQPPSALATSLSAPALMQRLPLPVAAPAPSTTASSP